jgi:DNA topoisomerase-1
MAEATFDSVVVEIDNNSYTFKSSGKTPIFDGFMKVYNTNKKKAKTEDEEEDVNSKLPVLEKDDVLGFKNMKTTQKFTKPASRYTEASLVKEMEDKGIGRPATYTPTITLLSSRKYIQKEGKYLTPTELGEQLIGFLIKGYEGLFNVNFTADMEDKLDKIANNETDYLSVMTKFNEYLEKLLGQTIEPIPTGIKCEKCGHEMVKRVSRYGEFLACSNFPNCKNIHNIVKAVGICPKCKGEVIERRSKNGKIFYGCGNYPNCDFISWEIPIEESCPKCNGYLTQKEFYGKLRKKCGNAECDYTSTVSKNAKSKSDNETTKTDV